MAMSRDELQQLADLIVASGSSGPDARRGGRAPAIVASIIDHTLLRPDATRDDLVAAVRIPTISTPDPAASPTEEFARLHTFFAETFPLVHEQLTLEKVGSSLLYTWTGTKGELPPVLVARRQPSTLRSAINLR